ncbi:unnamed protein product, partial [Polarella glacialis]
VGAVLLMPAGAALLGNLAPDGGPPASEFTPGLVGSAVNSDGRSASLTAPNGPAQQEVLLAAFLAAGRSPSELCTAECHGTGTALGDPIEIGALARVRADCAEGWLPPVLAASAKPLLGHAEAAAGALGLARLLACCRLSASCGAVASPGPHLR